MFFVNDRHHHCLKTTVHRPLLSSLFFSYPFFLSHFYPRFPAPFWRFSPPFSRRFPAVSPLFSRHFSYLKASRVPWTRGFLPNRRRLPSIWKRKKERNFIYLLLAQLYDSRQTYLEQHDWLVYHGDAITVRFADKMKTKFPHI
jgi:hypothetical protein